MSNSVTRITCIATGGEGGSEYVKNSDWECGVKRLKKVKRRSTGDCGTSNPVFFTGTGLSKQQAV